MFNTLDKLPKPDVILASPPCESWSNASAMERGNACWKQEKGDSLFEPQIPLSNFTVRDYNDYENYQFIPEKQIITRINGELTAINTIEIIKRYKPKVYMIENPAYGRIWEYIDRVIGFKPNYENLTFYNNYDYEIQKPTKFKSNINLELDSTRNKSDYSFKDMNWSYNQRSNIPEKLVEHIFKKIIKEFD